MLALHKPRKVVEAPPEPMSLDQQQVAERRLALIVETEKIAEDYAARIMQLRADPTSGPTVLLLVNGVPARLLN
jgi:hypothetical protein